MKNLKEIINSNPVFMNDFENEVDVACEFLGCLIDHNDYYGKSNMKSWKMDSFEEEKEKVDLFLKQKVNKILFASYGNDSYWGDAFVLFEKDGKLFEVNASHCSCFGLENQWEEEEVELKELEHRLINGTFGESYCFGNQFKEELKEFLGLK